MRLDWLYLKRKTFCLKLLVQAILAGCTDKSWQTRPRPIIALAKRPTSANLINLVLTNGVNLSRLTLIPSTTIMTRTQMARNYTTKHTSQLTQRKVATTKIMLTGLCTTGEMPMWRAIKLVIETSLGSTLPSNWMLTTSLHITSTGIVPGPHNRHQVSSSKATPTMEWTTCIMPLEFGRPTSPSSRKALFPEETLTGGIPEDNLASTTTTCLGLATLSPGWSLITPYKVWPILTKSRTWFWATTLPLLWTSMKWSLTKTPGLNAVQQIRNPV
jgi:hypothetical protein